MPSNWKIQRVGDLVASLDTGVSVNSEDRQKLRDEIGVLKISAVSYGRFDPAEYKAVAQLSEKQRLDVIAKADTVIVSRANTFDLVGASVYVDRDYPDLFLPDKLWRITTKPDICARWLNYMLTTELMRSQIMSRATGTSGSMKNISQRSFLAIHVDVPPLSEQRKIAQVLSTWDEAIATVEQLIAVLQLRKKGLMQRLLTGQVRFPEFEGSEWQEVELGDVLKPISRNENVRPDRDYRLIGVRWYLAGAHVHDVVPGDQIVTKALSRIEENDILYNKMWVSKAAFAVAKKEHAGAYGSGEYPQFVVQNGLDVSFLENAFHDPRFQHDATSMCRGTTGRIRLHPDDFLKLKLRTPQKAEQIRIAEVLQAADEEINEVTRYLDALRLQKKGLMQRLLTGQVRVQVEEELTNG